MEFKYICDETIELSKFLYKKGFTSKRVFDLIANSSIFVNDVCPQTRRLVLNRGDRILLKLIDESPSVIVTKGDLNILYEDEYFLIVDKPKDLDVEPVRNNPDKSLSNFVASYYVENNIKSNIHLVNRLDRVTSGIVIFAKNGYIHFLMKNVDISKKYLALVSGEVDEGEIKIKISKSDSTKRIVDPNGKECETKYRKIKMVEGNTLVEIDLLTGRTHQIRVSFDSIGHPLVGDRLYGSVKGEFYLRAYYISFIHPITFKEICISK